MDDSVSTQGLPSVSCSQLREQIRRALVGVAQESQAPIEPLAPAAASQRRRRGRPTELSQAHLWLGLLWAVLEGLSGYRMFTRWLATHAVGGFAPVSLTASAVLQRLQQAGFAPLQDVVSTLGARMQRGVPAPTCALASFASHILAVDESKLDALVRRLPWQRQHRVGDPALLAGQLAALFDIRQQRWLRVQYVSDALRNCKLEVLALLEDLPWHSLLLFDLGYFSFPFFDYLSERDSYWISRYREKTRYHLLHVYYQHGVMLDALVWLGSAHGPRAGRAVRLVRFGDGKQVRMYLTNVRDPLQLPMGDIARLSARRWDIELAFVTLKELLGLHHWWSSQLALLLQQISVTLVLAQVLQALRLHLAEQAGCDPFDVSLPLLVQHLPHLLRACLHPLDWLLTHGHKQGFVRPSSRFQVLAPTIPAEQVRPLPADLVLTRKANYRTYKPRPPRPASNQKKQAKADASASSPPTTRKVYR
ncbi:MAG TPA: IS4 family transposase [Ktedonobacteraceae bacterium]|nr:IS4 family transposase [Ktedonobacteraceae bacterium]